MTTTIIRCARVLKLGALTLMQESVENQVTCPCTIAFQTFSAILIFNFLSKAAASLSYLFPLLILQNFANRLSCNFVSFCFSLTLVDTRNTAEFTWEPGRSPGSGQFLEPVS